jgi:hypothetical protein
MTLVERGRFCASCRKVVTELTPMTEAEVRTLMRSPPEGLCVRYLADERGEIIFRKDVVASGGDDTPQVPPPQPLAGTPIPHMGVPRPVEPAKPRWWPSFPKRSPTPDKEPILIPDDEVLDDETPLSPGKTSPARPGTGWESSH